MEHNNNINQPPPPFNNPWDPPPPPPPPPPLPPPGTFEWGGPAPFHHHHNHQPFHPFNPPPPPPPPDHFAPGFNRKPQPFFAKRKFVADNGNHAKLYAAVIPRNVSQEEIHHLFEEHGNIIEVVLLTDKKTGLQQEFCFVKYASVEEAEKAIMSLNNRFTFPGAMAPLRVKYADGERQRLGLDNFVQQDPFISRSVVAQHGSTFSGPAITGEVEHKVYVNGLNREASRQEIVDIFSSYGDVADVYVMRDELKQSRGCGFVGFTHRYMAMAAINGLNGTYVMRGCDMPLIVRFADPKKPKNGDFRPAPNFADTRHNNLSNAHLANSSSSTNLNPTGIQAGIFCPVANQFQCPTSTEMQQPLAKKPFSPSRFSQISLQQSETSQASSEPSKSSRQTDSQPQTPMGLNRASSGGIEQQHDHQSPQACRDAELNSEIDWSIACGDCDWSEHICPDGDKYYFNCVTSESRWEKPEEFALYEEELQRYQLQMRSCQKPHLSSASEDPNSDRHIDASQNQGKPCDFEKSQMPVSCAVEHGHEKVQVETSSVGGPAFVQ